MSVAVTSLGERIVLLEKPGIIRTAIPQSSKVMKPTAKLRRMASIVTGNIPNASDAIPFFSQRILRQRFLNNENCT